MSKSGRGRSYLEVSSFEKSKKLNLSETSLSITENGRVPRCSCMEKAESNEPQSVNNIACWEIELIAS